MISATLVLCHKVIWFIICGGMTAFSFTSICLCSSLLRVFSRWNVLCVRRLRRCVGTDLKVDTFICKQWESHQILWIMMLFITCNVCCPLFGPLFHPICFVMSRIVQQDLSALTSENISVMDSSVDTDNLNNTEPEVLYELNDNLHEDSSNHRQVSVCISGV